MGLRHLFDYDLIHVIWTLFTFICQFQMRPGPHGPIIFCSVLHILFIFQYATIIECKNKNFIEPLSKEDRPELKVTGMIVD